MAKIRKRPAAFIVLAAFLALAASLNAYAGELKAEDIDTEAEMSLTVNFEVGEYAVAGAQISIYKAADVYTKGGAVFYTALMGDCDYEGLSAAESNEIAAELAQTAAESAQVQYSASTDLSGSAVFEDLEPGIYLVVLESSAADDEGTEYVFDPFLACVPLAMEEDGVYVWTYDVVSTPKVSDYIEAEGGTETETETDTETGTETETGETGSPETGDESRLRLWVLAASLCAALGGACVYMIRLKKKAGRER